MKFKTGEQLKCNYITNCWKAIIFDILFGFSNLVILPLANLE